jgi:Lipocalin-like domain
MNAFFYRGVLAVQFTSDNLMEALMEATPEEIKIGFEGYMSYCGCYEVHERERFVMYHQQLSWFPNWVETDQKRYFEFNESRLSQPQCRSQGKKKTLGQVERPPHPPTPRPLSYKSLLRRQTPTPKRIALGFRFVGESDLGISFVRDHIYMRRSRAADQQRSCSRAMRRGGLR